MSVLHKCLSTVIVATGLYASTAWAARMPFPHAGPKKLACPTAVERGAEKPNALNFSAGEKKGENEKAKGGAAGKGQDGMLLPAVKPGATVGLVDDQAEVTRGSGGGGGGGAGKSQGGGGGTGKSLGAGDAVKADPPGGKS